MPVKKMVRKAADNKYLHNDFHNILNLGIEYLREHFGDESVREYLRQFADSFYTPLKEDLKKRGLEALYNHFYEIYRVEEALDDVSFVSAKNTLMLNIKRCPAVTHMVSSGVAVSPLFLETSKTVCETICEGTEYAYELLSYNEADGASIQRFYRREA